MDDYRDIDLDRVNEARWAREDAEAERQERDIECADLGDGECPFWPLCLAPKPCPPMTAEDLAVFD